MNENSPRPCVFDLSTMGLQPVKHRIIGITTKCAEEERIFANRDERTLLIIFWEYIRSMRFTELIGFNSSEFDIPMLIVRSVIHKVPISDIVHKSIDLRKVVFNGVENKCGKLTEFQELLGIEFPESRYRKMDMFLLWSTPEMHELEQFLLRDVKVTWTLYEHTREAGLI
jgi:DNA polymerase elongation subunit (family B)